MNKNIYNNTANINALPAYQGEATPKTTAFAVVDGENVRFETEDILRYPANIASLQAQPLNENTRHILGVIATYEYMTTKMIGDCMSLLGLPVDQKKILTATERLRKTGLIHSFRFKAEDDNSKGAIFIVHTLTKLGGENAMKVLGISVPQVDTYNVVMNPALVKKKLATNQVLFAQLKHNASALKGFDKSKRLAADEEHTVVKPSLVLQFKDESMLCYEVVRRGAFWKTEFADKMERYKVLQDSWDNSSIEMPTLVICCEDEAHALEVNRIVRDLHVRSFLTHDLLLFGETYYRHLFTFNEKDEPVYFKIYLDEEKEVC